MIRIKKSVIELFQDLFIHEDNLQFYRYQAENHPNDMYWVHHIEESEKYIENLRKAIDKEIGSMI